MRAIGFLGLLILGGCTASMSEPTEPCEGDACDAASSEGKADLDRRAVIRDGDPVPAFTVRLHRPMEFGTSAQGLHATMIVAGRDGYLPASGVYCSVHRAVEGRLERTDRLYLKRPWVGTNGTVYFPFVEPNPEQLQFFACARVGGGEITYGEVESAFYSPEIGARLAFEPIAPFSADSVITTSEGRTRSDDAEQHCATVGGRQPWTIELEALVEQGYSGFDPEACYWAANSEGAVRFSENAVREEAADRQARACNALCVRGYASSIEWGEFRGVIEGALGDRPSSAYPLLDAERALHTTEGFTRVVEVLGADWQTFDIYYTNDAGDRCAKIHVDGYQSTTELDVCPE